MLDVADNNGLFYDHLKSLIPCVGAFGSGDYVQVKLRLGLQFVDSFTCPRKGEKTEVFILNGWGPPRRGRLIFCTENDAEDEPEGTCEESSPAGMSNKKWNGLI